MKLIKLTAAACLFLAINMTTGFAAPMAVKAKGTIKFLSDAPLEKIVGNAPSTGTFTIDTSDLSTMRGEASLQVASMKTGNDIRDEHLRGDDWLEANKYPTIKFVIKSAAADGDLVTKGEVTGGNVVLTGDLSIHGVTKEIKAKANVKWKGDKFKITSSFSISLADYKVQGASGVVGKKVGKTIQLNVALKGKGA